MCDCYIDNGELIGFRTYTSSLSNYIFTPVIKCMECKTFILTDSYTTEVFFRTNLNMGDSKFTLFP